MYSDLPEMYFDFVEIFANYSRYPNRCSSDYLKEINWHLTNYILTVVPN